VMYQNPAMKHVDWSVIGILRATQHELRVYKDWEICQEPGLMSASCK